MDPIQQPQEVQPQAQAQPQPQGGIQQSNSPGQKRDYKANPLNDQDREHLEKYRISATKILMSEQGKKAVLKRIKGKVHPYKDIARAAVSVASRVEAEAQKNGVQIDPAVQSIGLATVVKQVAQLAYAAGKVNKPPKSEDMRIMFGQAMKEKGGQSMRVNPMSKKEGADIFGRFANNFFKATGNDPRGYYQSIHAAVQNQQDPTVLNNREPQTMAQKLEGGLL